MTTRPVPAAALAIGALLLTAGCSSGPAASTSATGTSSSPSASTPASGSTGSTIDISGFAFSAVTVKPGATVTVTNSDSVTHTVNVNGTQIDVHVPGGGQATFTAPTTPGSYPLTCDVHPSMHGVLTVAA